MFFLPARGLSVIFAVATATVAIPAFAHDWSYNINAKTFSTIPDEGITSYRRSGEGNVTIGSTVGLGISFDGKQRTVQYSAKKRDGSLFADITINEKGTEDERLELDLSDGKPQSIDLGVAKDGRRYYVSFSATATKIDRQPKTVSVESLSFTMWQFHSSAVLIDDAVYVGRLGGSGAVANMSICGVADVEFSLESLSGWQPWGTLQEGTVTITHPSEGTTIQVLNTRNGPSNDTIILPGGPYQVWVRWREPSSSCEGVWKFARKARQRALDGGLSKKSPQIDLIDRQLAREPGPWITNSGFRDLRSRERR